MPDLDERLGGVLVRRRHGHRQGHGRGGGDAWSARGVVVVAVRSSWRRDRRRGRRRRRSGLSSAFEAGSPRSGTPPAPTGGDERRGGEPSTRALAPTTRCPGRSSDHSCAPTSEAVSARAAGDPGRCRPGCRCRGRRRRRGARSGGRGRDASISADPLEVVRLVLRERPRPARDAHVGRRQVDAEVTADLAERGADRPRRRRRRGAPGRGRARARSAGAPWPGASRWAHLRELNDTAVTWRCSGLGTRYPLAGRTVGPARRRRRPSRARPRRRRSSAAPRRRPGWPWRAGRRRRRRAWQTTPRRSARRRRAAPGRRLASSWRRGPVRTSTPRGDELAEQAVDERARAERRGVEHRAGRRRRCLTARGRAGGCAPPGDGGELRHRRRG